MSDARFLGVAEHVAAARTVFRIDAGGEVTAGDALSNARTGEAMLVHRVRDGDQIEVRRGAGLTSALDMWEGDWLVVVPRA